jgi:hypothetical protein
MTGDETPLLLEILRIAGPFVAAAVALYLAQAAERRQRRQRPDLRLLYEHTQSDDLALAFGRHEAHWVRLRVANRWGKRTAEDVEVLVVDVRPRDGKGSLNGWVLQWSNARGADGQPLTRQTIPPGVARHIDLVCVKPKLFDADGDSAPVEGESDASFELRVVPIPRDERRWLAGASNTVLLALMARDTDAAYYAVKIDHDGKWWSAEHVREHLTVSVRSAHYFALEPEAAWDRMLSRRDRAFMHLELVRWLNPRNWKAMRTVRRARREYPGRAVHIDASGRITPVDELMSTDD